MLKVKMLEFPQIKSTQMHDFFEKQHQLKLAKNQAKAKQHPVTKFLLFENYSHSKIIGNIIKNIQKTSTFV